MKAPYDLIDSVREIGKGDFFNMLYHKRIYCLLCFVTLVTCGMSQADIAYLPLICGEVGWTSTTNDWQVRSLASEELSDLTNGAANLHVESSYYCYSPPNGYSIASPEITLWFDAGDLIPGSPITVTATASIRDRNADTTANMINHHPSYGWEYCGNTVASWDTAITPQTQVYLNRGGYGAAPFYQVTNDMIGLKIGCFISASGGGLPITEVYTLDLNEVTIIGEVPEPATLSLLVCSGMVLLKRKS